MTQDYLQKYIELCSENLKDNNKVLSLLKNTGIYEKFIFDNINIGFSNGSLLEIIGDNEELLKFFNETGITKNNKEVFANYITIPIYNENKAIINIAFYNLYPQSKNKLQYLNQKGIFNSHFLKNNKEVILTSNPIETLLLIQKNYPAATFLIGDDNKYIKYFGENNINKAIFTFDGRARLFYELTRSGISSKRVIINFDKLKEATNNEYLEKIFNDN